jgi:hypothetical protein
VPWPPQFAPAATVAQSVPTVPTVPSAPIQASAASVATSSASSAATDPFITLHKPLNALLEDLNGKIKLILAGGTAGGWANFARSALIFQKIIKDSTRLGSSKNIGTETRNIMVRVAETILEAADVGEEETVILATRLGSHIKCLAWSFIELWYHRQMYWIRFYDLGQDKTMAKAKRLLSSGLVQRPSSPMTSAIASFDSIRIDPDAVNDEAEYKAKHKTAAVPRLWSEEQSTAFLGAISRPLAEVRRHYMKTVTAGGAGSGSGSGAGEGAGAGAGAGAGSGSGVYGRV